MVVQQTINAVNVTLIGFQSTLKVSVTLNFLSEIPNSR